MSVDVPLVSVVIPTFNSGQYAVEAIRSVLGQTHRGVEVLVIDDGSTDGTPENIRKIADPRVGLHLTQHRGVASARNVGIGKARGALIAFLDHDDLWYPTKLERQISWLREDPSLCLVGCYMDLMTDVGRVIGRTGQKLGRRDREQIALGRLMPFPLSSVVIRRPALEHVGGFDEELETSRSGGVDDLDLLARLATYGGIGCVPEPLGSYRHHSASFTAGHFRLQRMGTRFVQHRCEARLAGRELTWSSFVENYRPTLDERRGDAAATRYYAAGMNAIDRRWGRAGLNAAVSLLLAPRYTLTRLRVNRPWRV